MIYENRAPPVFMVFDQENRNRYAMGTMLPGITPERFIKAGYIKRADTLEALAVEAGIDPAGLQQTIARFNTMAAAGRDEDFHKGDSAFDRYAGDPAHKPNPCLGPLAKAPFHAMQIQAGDLGTKGGLLTNAHDRFCAKTALSFPDSMQPATVRPVWLAISIRGQAVPSARP